MGTVGVLIRHLQGKRNSVSNFKIRESLTVVPVDRLFGTFIIKGRYDRIFLLGIYTILYNGGIDAVIVAYSSTKVDRASDKCNKIGRGGD